jgi:Flp pilus assembly protein TadG
MPVSRPPYVILKRPVFGQRGQSLVEFAISSVVLVLLVGGLVDVGRAIFFSEVLSNAAREGARHGAWFDAAKQSNPYISEGQIKTAVDAELATLGLPPALLQSSNCPAPSDGNAYHNPPFPNAAYPTGNQPLLYVCYNNAPGPPPANMIGLDLNVIVLYTYSPITPIANQQFGIFHVAVNQHITVQ